VEIVGLLNKTNTDPGRTWRPSQDELGVEAAPSLWGFVVVYPQNHWVPWLRHKAMTEDTV
jgi:hypothetical protein